MIRRATQRIGRDDLVRMTLRRYLENLAHRMHLPEAPVVALADEATPTHQRKGETILSPSSIHTFSYMAVAGVVRFECRDHRDRPLTLQLIRPGRLFGVSWRPHQKPRAIRAVAHTDVHVFVVG